jgi:hypothetical protein
MPNHVHLMILLFLLLNIAGKSVAKYLDTSLDWADNNEKLYDLIQIDTM